MDVDRRWSLACLPWLALLQPGSAFAQVDSFQRGMPAADVRVYEQARSLRAQKHRDQAIALLQGLVGRQPDYFNAQFELALALSDTPESIGQSIPVFEKAAALKRGHPEVTDARVFNSLGWAYMYNGDTAKARQAFTEAEQNLAQLTPQFQGKLYNNIGNLNLSTGKASEAKKSFAIAADKGSQQAKFNLQVLEAANKRQQVKKE